ncbi:MAG: glutamate-5-semialdehyde dehydrogenase [Clostridia bacterium]|nr:glutamate-5-semialdehyde dehydrogenase [Clostridia bacterium]
MKKSVLEILTDAKTASRSAFTLTSERKNAALLAMATALEQGTEEILAANALDLENAKGVLSSVMLDRLRLDTKRIAAMAQGIRDVAALPDPVGQILENTTLPNGLRVSKTRVPLGVIGIIYESRPNVTSDAAALCFKSGNACVLRGGKDAYFSSAAIVGCLRGALRGLGIDENFVCMPSDTSRESANVMMTAVGLLDALIPRGGAGLIRSCVENAKVPCIQTGTGICHIYVDEHADLDKALAIVENAKTSRPSVCNAAEVCLVHEKIAETFLPRLRERLVENRAAAGLPTVSFRVEGETALALLGGEKASEQDFDTEFLDYILAVKTVSDVDEAISHIARHSTAHSDCIVTENTAAAEKFTLAVDSAAVYVNASTRFTDGGEFGKGCEIGISTQKLHARGPMGLEELTSYKYIVRGNGQIR